MVDVNNSAWSETDASNNSTPPDGWPEGMNPAAVNDTGRAMMGAIKRWFNRANATITSSGTNTVTLTYTTAPAAYVAGDLYAFIAGGTNTSSVTLNINSLGAKAVQRNGSALTGGEIHAGGLVLVAYDGTQFQLLSRPTGSPAPGNAVNVKASLATAGTSITVTADAVVVADSLSGASYLLTSFSKTFDGTGTGAGKMDTGAIPTSGFLALYAIYNPSTGTASILGKNAGTTSPTIYDGADMPSGYTASALLCVVPTNSTPAIKACYVAGRRCTFFPVTALSTNTSQTSLTSLSISAAVPPAALTVQGEVENLLGSSSSAGQREMFVSPDSNGIGECRISSYISGDGTGYRLPFLPIRLATAQTIYWADTTSGTNPAFRIYVTGYEI